MFTNGTLIAVTDPHGAAMQALLGIQADYGAARVVAPVPIEDVPENYKEGAPPTAEFYLVEPIDLATETLPEGHEDCGYLAGWSVEMPVAFTEQIGQLSTAVVLSDRFSKSAYLAEAEARVESAVAELRANLNEFAELQDNELDPTFLATDERDEN